MVDGKALGRVRFGRFGQMSSATNISILIFVAAAAAAVLCLLWFAAGRNARRRRIHEDNERYRALSGLASEGVSIHEDGIIVEANQAFAEMYGYSVAELIGKPVLELTVPEHREQVAERLAQNISGTYESISYRKDGSRIPIEIKAMPTVYNGRSMRVTLLRDLTDQQAAEKAIRDSERQLRLITDAMPALIVYVDAEFRYQFVNRVAEIWHDCPASELIGKYIGDRVDEATFRAAKRQYDKARGGVPQFFEEAFTYPDGKTRDVSASYVPHLDDDGTLLGFFALVLDITARKEAERAVAAGQEELRQREESQRNILVSTPVPLVISRIKDGTILFANQAYAAVLGLDPDQLIQQSSMRTYLQPEDRQQLLRELKPEGKTNREMQLRKSDGSSITVSGSIQRIDFEGEEAILSSFLDVSERRRAEEQLQISEARFRDFAASASDWYWEQDENMVFTYVSPNVLEILQLPASHFIGKSRHEIMPESIDPVDWQPFFDAMRERRAFRGLVIHRRETGGGDRWLSSTGLPIFSETGEFKGYRGTATDITALKKAEESLLQSQKMEAVGQLTGGIAHDFNNLLAIMTGNIALLEDDLGPEHEAAELLEPTMRAIEQATELISRMLAFSRRQPLAMKVVDVNALLDNMQSLLHRSLGKEIEVMINAGADLPPCLTDPGQLEQAILNLAINARDAMPNGGRLCLETSQVSLPHEHLGGVDDLPPGQYLEITVSDNGQGISLDDQSKIFDPFFTTKGVGKGTGLGLSMVYGLIKQSDGHITVTSNLGVGTTFRIYLPRASGKSAIEQAAPSTHQVKSGNEKTILVIEDEPDVAKMISRILKKHGYNILFAGDGPAGLDMLAGHPGIDLLLTDIMLPGGLNGNQIAAAARAEDPALKVLFMTGYARDIVIKQGRLEPDMPLLTKPFTPARLIAQIAEVLGEGVVTEQAIPAPPT